MRAVARRLAPLVRIHASKGNAIGFCTDIRGEASLTEQSVESGAPDELQRWDADLPRDNGAEVVSPPGDEAELVSPRDDGADVQEISLSQFLAELSPVREDKLRRTRFLLEMTKSQPATDHGTHPTTPHTVKGWFFYK